MFTSGERREEQGDHPAADEDNASSESESESESESTLTRSWPRN
jgi:hypothetical protein